MDTEARIEAAKARLDAGRAVLIRAGEAGPPCTQCAYYIQAPPPGYGRPTEAFCGHLAYTEQAFTPVDGKVVETIQVPAAKARSDDGLCGFEGALFERSKRSILARCSVAFFVAMGLITLLDVI